MEAIWHRTAEIMPLIAALAIFESVTLLRRWSRKAYVPAYFAFIHSATLDKKVASYYLNDCYDEAVLDSAEAGRLRRRIMVHGLWSGLIYAWVTPIAVATFSSQCMRYEDFVPLVWLICAFQAYKVLLIFLDPEIYQFPLPANGKGILALYSVLITGAAVVSLLFLDREFRHIVVANGNVAVLGASWEKIVSGLAIPIVGNLLATPLAASLLRADVRETIRLESEELGAEDVEGEGVGGESI